MDISQIIGFIISVLAILYIVTKRVKEERLRKEHPEEYEKEQQKQEANLKQFLKSLDVEMEDKKMNPPPKPVQKLTASQASKTVKKENLPPKPQRIVSDEFIYKSDLDNVHLKNDISQRKIHSHIEDKYTDIYGERVVSVDLREVSNRTYEVIQKIRVSRGEKLLQSMPTKKNMVILYEIYGTPKGLQK